MSYILRYWKLGLQYILWEGGEDTIQSIMITNSDCNMLYIPISLNLIITIILPIWRVRIFHYKSLVPGYRADKGGVKI